MIKVFSVRCLVFGPRTRVYFRCYRNCSFNPYKYGHLVDGKKNREYQKIK